MRQITRESIAAFYNEFTFGKSNMSVSTAYGKTGKALIDDNYEGNFNFTTLSLFGNKIAYLVNGEDLYITNCGWQSNTTKERLNGLRGVCIHQSDFVWYLNDKPWSGELTKI